MKFKFFLIYQVFILFFLGSCSNILSNQAKDQSKLEVTIFRGDEAFDNLENQTEVPQIIIITTSSIESRNVQKTITLDQNKTYKKTTIEIGEGDKVQISNGTFRTAIPIEIKIGNNQGTRHILGGIDKYNPHLIFYIKKEDL